MFEREDSFSEDGSLIAETTSVHVLREKIETGKERLRATQVREFTLLDQGLKIMIRFASKWLSNRMLT